MGITVDMSRAFAKLDDLAVKVQQGAPNFLASVGEKVCDAARATKTYTDVTGRLTASIGYGVVVDGSLAVTGGFGGGEGEAEGMATLQRAVSEVPSTCPTLLIVAGMHYAVYVERKGFSVLDGARFRVPGIASEVSTSRLLKLLAA